MHLAVCTRNKARTQFYEKHGMQKGKRAEGDASKFSSRGDASKFSSTKSMASEERNAAAKIQAIYRGNKAGIV